MTAFEKYTLILCFIVFAMLVSLSVVVITIIYKQSIKLIKLGADDDKIVQVYNKQIDKKKEKLSKIIDYTISIILALVLFFCVFVSVFINYSQDKYFGDLPTFRVVKTSSMANKHEKNTYLLKNNLNNQIDAFDLISTYKIPDEKDIKLYDIVVYEVDGIFLVHRVVKIEEPNQYHPEERWFTCQGDAVESPDRFPVKYSQIKGIYRGERIPFIGSFVLFMQSPAGWMCAVLVLVALIGAPILEKRLENERIKRFALIQPVVATEEVEPAPLTDKNQSLLIPFGRGNRITFREKLARLNKERLIWFNQILSALYTIDGLRVSESKRGMTFRKGNKTLAKLIIRGKTLTIFMAVEPSEYLQSKYGSKDLSSVKAYKTVPTQFKLTSERRVGYVKDVVFDKLGGNRNNYTYVEYHKGLQVAQGNAQEVAVTVLDNEQTNRFNFAGQRKTFVQKLALLDNERLVWFNKLVGAFKTVDKVKILLGNRCMTFRKGNKTLAKLIIRGKTLTIFMAVEPGDYLEPKYGAKDLSSVKAYKTVPTQFKLTSERRLGYVMDVVFEKLGGNREKFKINKERFVEKDSQTVEYNRFNFIGERKTFEQKLALIGNERLAWYTQLVSAFKTIEGAKEILSKRGLTFRKGNKTLAKLIIRGKTLTIFMAVEPSDYLQSKYGAKDLSLVKAYKTVPTQFKLTSERRLGYVTDIVYDKFGGVREKDFANTYYGRKNYSFKKKLSLLSNERKAWYKELTAFLKQNAKLTRYDSKKGVSFKKGLKPIVKFAIKNKSLYAYIGANPADYISAHLGGKDVSMVKAHANYPLQVKITSNRKIKKVKKILESIW